jgi:ABC-type multidrug transport system fused ATPase/permease subunit
VPPGEVLGEAWALYKAHWRHFLPLALLVFVVLSLVSLLLSFLLGWFGAVLATVVGLVGVFWLQGALCEAVADVRDGRADLSISETLQKVRPRLAPLLGAGVLAGLGVAVGLLLLIVPGLLLLTWWSVIIPVIVLERVAAMESFGRSRELVRGHGWNVFGVIVLTVLILLLVAIVLAIILAILLAWLPDEVRGYIQTLVSNSLTAPFLALAWTLMYFRLRDLERPAEPAPIAA